MTRRADYDEAEQLAAAEARTAELPRDRFTLADRQLCERIAAERYEASVNARRMNPRAGVDDELTGGRWSDLAVRIQRALVGTFATFTAGDALLIETEHLALLRTMPAELSDELGRARVKAKSRGLSRLGVLVVLASRGKLEQLRGRGA